ncbi:MAG: VWA domain-containing protein [Oscillospiraceae bacterium]|nr:VWA domain-containing protein [Oscillospiraceae bacterium]
MKIIKNNVVKFILLAILVFGISFGIILATRNAGPVGPDRNTISQEASIKKMNELYRSISINTLSLKIDELYIDDEELVTVLPDISEYPFVVNPTTDEFLTVYSSSESAGTDLAGWFAEVADKFNQSGLIVDGKPVSVGVRSMTSGLGADFISSGKYKPDIYIPASELYGNILISKGIKVNLIQKRTAGNVAGLVISRAKNEELVNKYGSISSKIIADCVINGELIMGYTNPLSSSEGLNFLLTLLHTFDAENPLSEPAVTQLTKFQDKIPFTPYNIRQLSDSTAAGVLDGFASDYLTYFNSPASTSGYVFIPFGVRHDQPVYEIGDLPAIKKQICEKFLEYCSSPESQTLANNTGLNNFEDYIPDLAEFDGAAIIQAQEIWKREKNGSSDLTAVFVADISGSMEGSPLLRLKASLNRASSFIDANTNIGLVTFSNDVNIALPIGKFDVTQKAYFSNAVKSMSAGGGTAMFDAIVAAQKMLMDAKEQNPNTRLMLFVLTDGETNQGYSFDDIESMSRGLRIPIYTIGYNADIEILKEVSDINEAATIDAETDDVIYRLQNLFNAQM